jgi:hypothetical protein
LRSLRSRVSVVFSGTRMPPRDCATLPPPPLRSDIMRNIDVSPIATIMNRLTPMTMFRVVSTVCPLDPSRKTTRTSMTPTITTTAKKFISGRGRSAGRRA